MASWAYPPPFEVYDSHDPAVFLTGGPDDEGCYPAVDDAGRLVAVAVVAAEARVRAQQPAEGVVDIGLGVRPDATNRGLGSALFPQVLALARELPGARTARVAVALFNERSLALCRAAGFEDARELTGPGGRPFREMVLSLGPPT